ncbi:MAG: 3-dehydroquinate synthase [Nitrospirae bacterium]|nr:3-dehydroquinate synthase [Nitrospirota bacterium]MCL5420978.1 3-dehydroquinate synthase [Nitrospirota bacterium]
MQEIRVELGERSYGIFIDAGMLKDLGEKVKGINPSRVAVISNPTVYGLYGAVVSDSLKRAGLDAPLVLIPDGEGYKELLWAYYLFGELLKQRLDRASALIALGGGVIGDITGFVASTYMRGISFIQVPTTLLAQVDSSVGGKTGVNHPLGKNMIGTFYQPRLVWADISTLQSLPKREFLAGIAEVIKYGVIWDEALFRFLEDNREKILNLDRHALEHIIKRSCEIKAEVVSRDEREGGLRAILNYGHTIGHALEAATGYTSYLHGEAVAVGMYLETRLSSLLGLMDTKETERIRDLIRSYGLPSEMPQDMDAEKILSSMRLDKKAVAGELKFILPERIGSVRTRKVTDTARIIESVRG